MRNILVIGGTRYFGKRLVDLLLKNKDDVTVATRGLNQNPFGDKVKILTLDHTKPESLKAALAGTRFDLIYDQTCYSGFEAQALLDALPSYHGRLVHTSTSSTYLDINGLRSERDFNPRLHDIKKLRTRDEVGYGQAKQDAEAVFFQRAQFPVVAMRIPIVLGPDDYTRRLHFHVEQVRNLKTIVIPNLKAETSLISSEDAARFLFDLGLSQFRGPINGASSDTISIGKIIHNIELALNQTALIKSVGAEKDQSPLVGPKSQTLDVSEALKSGFKFQTLDQWLPALIQHIALNPES